MRTGGREWQVVVYACCTVALAACAGSGQPEPKIDPNVFPSDYKAEVIKVIPTVIADPQNMRDTGISDLALTPVGGESRYTACVRFNAKKSATEYEGVEERYAIFFAGHVVQFIPATPQECGKVAYKPFPELSQICFGETCKRNAAGK